MLYTEENVKANLRNREGRRVFYLGKGDTLTPGARDWLRRERIEILPAEQAKPDRYRLLGGGWLEKNVDSARKIVAAGHDQVAAAVGAGAFDGSVAVDGAGTVECLTPIFDEKPDLLAMSEKNYAVVPYVVPGKYVAYAFSCLCRFYSLIKRFSCGVHQSLGFITYISAREGVSIVAVESVDESTDIDRDYIALSENTGLGRYAMDNHVVYRNAGACGA